MNFFFLVNKKQQEKNQGKLSPVLNSKHLICSLFFSNAEPVLDINRFQQRSFNIVILVRNIGAAEPWYLKWRSFYWYFEHIGIFFNSLDYMRTIFAFFFKFIFWQLAQRMWKSHVKSPCWLLILWNWKDIRCKRFSFKKKNSLRVSFFFLFVYDFIYEKIYCVHYKNKQKIDKCLKCKEIIAT